jgi:Protein of unknown function (DUF2917)
MNVNTLSSAWLRWLWRSPVSNNRQSATASTTPMLVALARNQVLNISKENPTCRIEVRRGVIWLTETPAEKDIVLQTAEYFCPDGGYPLVIEALTEAEVILTR